MVVRGAARVSVLALGASLLLAPAPASAADSAALDGTSALTAAGSCWEIKQRHPDAGDGRYWIVTPAMQAPVQIYCDQTTDGGGWALVARGRERWTEAGGGTVGSGTWMTDLPIDGRNGTMIAKQLPGDDIDALLNNTRVDSLSDGIRLRRAANRSGTSWQEVRFTFANRDRWTWALAARHAVSSYSVDGTSTRAEQEMPDLRIANRDDANRSFTFATADNHFARGFNYGAGGPTGTSAGDSYLYSTRSDGKLATPFTQMYVRPRLERARMSFDAIGDAGRPAETNRPIVSSQAERNTWGVKGLGAGGTDFNATEVSAFTQIGNTMYVGGNFTTVRNNDTGKEYSQRYLAAFNATTGAWISSFRPRLNNQVKALAVLDRRLAVGGQFTQVNGRTRRSLVVLGPSSGRTYSRFNTDFAQTQRGAKLWVRTLLVRGNHLYVGGSFNRVRGAKRSWSGRYNIARLRGTDGAAYSWAPNLAVGLPQANGKNGTRSQVLDLSLSPDKATLYAAGEFSYGYVGKDGRAAVKKRGAVALTTGTTANFRSWAPKFSATLPRSQYQQAVRAVGDSVWVGGSQHSMVKYRASNRAFQRGNLTRKGGDIQAITSGGGVVYGSCHCNDWNYSDTLTYENGSVEGFTQADRIGYVGAWDATTGDYLPQFAPTSGTRSGEGPWAVRVASNGTLWSGGDYTAIVTVNDKSEWAGGFVRFARADTTAPSAPKNLTAHYNAGSNYAWFSWDPSASSGASYELLKDNRVIQIMDPNDINSSTENYKLATSSGRFFVRAVDAAGNRSATTPVVRIGGPTQNSSAARQAPQPDAETVQTVLVADGATWSTTAPGPDGVEDDWASPKHTPGTSWAEATALIGWGTPRAVSSFDERPGTFYVRRDFTIDDPGVVTTVTIRTLADDGAAIYVNGIEVGRKNLPAGALNESVSATAAPDGTDSLDWTISVPTSLLVAGRNVVAAEVHPASDATRDVAFDLQMVAEQ